MDSAETPPPPGFVPLPDYREYSPEEMRARARAFREQAERRRTVRFFSDRPIPDGVIEECLRAAGTAPSGANLQPWHFVVVRDVERKAAIRAAAEEEERIFYRERAPAEWLAALAPLGTDEHKPFLETAPCLIAVFVQRYGRALDGRKVKHYYAVESTGIATGILITALHHAGLATLTHTPSPMDFLNELLGGPRASGRSCFWSPAIRPPTPSCRTSPARRSGTSSRSSDGSARPVRVGATARPGRVVAAAARAVWHFTPATRAIPRPRGPRSRCSSRTAGPTPLRPRAG